MLKEREQAQNGVNFNKLTLLNRTLITVWGFPRNGILNLSVDEKMSPVMSVNKGYSSHQALSHCSHPNYAP